MKAQLQANFELAMAQQVFGVPTLAIGGELFWGADAHAFAMDYLAHPGMFEEGEMGRLGNLPIGLSRIEATAFSMPVMAVATMKSISASLMT